MEKEIKSVANITRNELSEMLRLAAKYGTPEVLDFPFEDANKALLEYFCESGVIVHLSWLKRPTTS